MIDRNVKLVESRLGSGETIMRAKGSPFTVVCRAGQDLVLRDFDCTYDANDAAARWSKPRGARRAIRRNTRAK